VGGAQTLFLPVEGIKTTLQANTKDNLTFLSKKIKILSKLIFFVIDA
jgi:hypothetical protein